MRLWSLHPSLLDPRGLVALWREALLAQHVLGGKTKGYRHHPQLHRFSHSQEPRISIASYLWAIHDEAQQRGYSFNEAKIMGERAAPCIAVSRGQLAFEWEHLKKKVRVRDRSWFRQLAQRRIRPHPLFMVVAGGIEPWERGPKSK